ncbi:MAG TPA: phage tail tip lysozyme [Tepidisphaeraceae bacterium]|nr:phage tail tip lysozyme [Tepidisphaeraceae bacterium]
MAIDPDFFAQQCVRMGLFCGTNPHYMLAVAKLRSGIADTNEGDQIGPFRLTQAQWIANSKESDLGFDFEPDDINLWTNQCSVFALMASRAFATFVTANNRNPSAKELYVAQFPAAASATLSTDLQQAITSTQGLVNPAIDEVCDEDPPSLTIDNPNQASAAVGAVRTSGPPVPAGRESIAVKIVTAFANAGLGTAQQAAGLANAIAESQLKPNAHAGGGEDSWGLFQLNRHGGLGTGHDPAELSNPDRNIALILAAAMRVSAFTRATTLEQAVSAFVAKVERPADVPGQTAKRLGIAQRLV